MKTIIIFGLLMELAAFTSGCSDSVSAKEMTASQKKAEDTWQKNKHILTDNQQAAPALRIPAR